MDMIHPLYFHSFSAGALIPAAFPFIIAFFLLDIFYKSKTTSQPGIGALTLVDERLVP